ncbi:hypothetical protein ACP70R_009256 [Stipagrostis hirtigluma subsp. patula]
MEYSPYSHSSPYVFPPILGNMKLLLVLCFLLLSGVHHVESRRHPSRQQNYKLFVFGDSFVDAGNVPKSEKSRMSRGWYYPYGSSDSDNDDAASGRYSNGRVQSDFVAKILRLEESPPPNRVREPNNADPSGVNFAAAGAGVFDAPDGEDGEGLPSLDRQIDQFSRLVNTGIIDGEDLDDSVALIGFSAARDYMHVTDQTSSTQVMFLCGEVTDAIVDGVRKLQKLGVSKVMVNSMPPLGCSPYRTRSNNYTHCSNDVVSNTHNMLLKKKLSDDAEKILLLDLNTVFSNLVEPEPGSSLSQHQFKHKFTPCCDTSDPSVYYCGEEDNNGYALYTLCKNPDNYFYWDYMHPTQAAWKVVMQMLQGQIEEFIGISSW